MGKGCVYDAFPGYEAVSGRGGVTQHRSHEGWSTPVLSTPLAGVVMTDFPV